MTQQVFNLKNPTAKSYLEWALAEKEAYNISLRVLKASKTKELQDFLTNYSNLKNIKDYSKNEAIEAILDLELNLDFCEWITK